MSPCEGANRRMRTSEAIKARRGVVKMLIASVIIYFLSYSPHQVLLFYNSFSAVPFHQTWVFLVLTTTLAYIQLRGKSNSVLRVQSELQKEVPLNAVQRTDVSRRRRDREDAGDEQLHGVHDALQKVDEETSAEQF